MHHRFVCFVRLFHFNLDVLEFFKSPSHICVYRDAMCSFAKSWKVLEGTREKTWFMGREAGLHQGGKYSQIFSVESFSTPSFIFVFSNPIEIPLHPAQSRTRIGSFFLAEKYFYSFVQKHKRERGKEWNGKVAVAKRTLRF